MFYSNVILKTLTFFIFFCIIKHAGGQTRLEIGERINGPANIRDTVNGKILFSLNDGVIIETSPAIKKWVKIGVYVKLTGKQMEAFKLEKDIPLMNEDGKTIGKTINPVEISMIEEEVGYIEAYTHQDNINIEFNPEVQLMKILAMGNYQKKTLEPFMKKFGFTEYQEDNRLKFTQYFIYESTVVDFSPLDRITLLFDKQNLVGYFHTRNMVVKGFKTHDLVRGHKLSVMETMANQDVKNLKQKRNAYYNSVD
jgi:2-hydroxy-3-keto-5-methylthiopentenyl-1-phosphate phosphatase